METTDRWHAATSPLRAYARRQPEKSPLYRLVYHYHDKLPLVWEERFQQRYGALRDEVTDVFVRYLDCGILAHGAARAECESCRHSILIAFSCKARGLCPACNAKRAALFGEHLHEKVLLAVPHRHLVFSLPKRLRVFFRYDRKLHDLLFRAARDTLLEDSADTSGLVLVVQTAGESLNHNPHLHGIITDGVFDSTGAFLPNDKPPDPAALTRRFEMLVTEALVERELLHPVHAEALLAQTHTGFSVWVGEPIPAGDADGRRFLGRYLARAPLSQERLSVTANAVRYRADVLDSWTGDPFEFLARLSVHIPDKWEQTTRYFGQYASRTRGKATRGSEPTILIELPEDPLPPSRSWARMMKRIFELDPLECPECGGSMKIKAFITDPKELIRLLDHLGIPKGRPPPPLPSEQNTDDLFH